MNGKYITDRTAHEKKLSRKQSFGFDHLRERSANLHSYKYPKIDGLCSSLSQEESSETFNNGVALIGQYLFIVSAWGHYSYARILFDQLNQCVKTMTRPLREAFKDEITKGFLRSLDIAICNSVGINKTPLEKVIFNELANLDLYFQKAAFERYQDNLWPLKFDLESKNSFELLLKPCEYRIRAKKSESEIKRATRYILLSTVSQGSTFFGIPKPLVSMITGHTRDPGIHTDEFARKISSEVQRNFKYR